MKKIVLLIGLAILTSQLCLSQDATSKTNLSLQVSQAAAANQKQQIQYEWNRTVQVFVNGELKNTIISAISFDNTGKVKTQEISSTPTSKMKPGIRGDIERNKIKEVKDYVDGAVKSSMKYIYMTEGQMVDYFNKATVTQPGNTINVQGNGVYQAGDNLTLVLNQGSLAFVSRSFATTYNGTDAVNGTLNYKTFSNGLTTMDAGEIDLPAKNIKLMVSNGNFAKVMH